MAKFLLLKQSPFSRDPLQFQYKILSSPLLIAKL